jgi:putative N6-adenine-specific DNA methylase
MQIVVKTLAGLEPVLAEELEALGAAQVRPLKRAVTCEGDTALLYRANYLLRTALRVLQPIHSFRARDERDLYEGIRSIPWHNFMGLSDTFAIDAITQSEVFRHSKYASLVAKDAIVDQFRDRTGQRPNVNPEAPHLRINLHIGGSLCEVALDASGDSLHRRNYRRDTVEAPLNEVLAAGMIALSGWKADVPFADPMCGSGTLVIEAAMKAAQMPTQYLRESFGFFKWRSFDSKLWRKIKSEADAAIQTELPVPIFAADKDVRACNATSINLMACGLDGKIKVEKAPFEKWVPTAAPGILITNPPYDERLQIENAVAFYKSIGDRLKQQWTGWDAWIISANRDALKHTGLHASRRFTLFNGALECSFQKFELYAGKKGVGAGVDV